MSTIFSSPLFSCPLRDRIQQISILSPENQEVLAKPISHRSAARLAAIRYCGLRSLEGGTIPFSRM
jgi:hypothetical protein